MEEGIVICEQSFSDGSESEFWMAECFYGNALQAIGAPGVWEKIPTSSPLMLKVNRMIENFQFDKVVPDSSYGNMILSSLCVPTAETQSVIEEVEEKEVKTLWIWVAIAVLIVIALLAIHLYYENRKRKKERESGFQEQETQENQK